MDSLYRCYFGILCCGCCVLDLRLLSDDVASVTLLLSAAVAVTFIQPSNTKFAIAATNNTNSLTLLEGYNRRNADKYRMISKWGFRLFVLM